MLPGALLQKARLRYICKQVYVRAETTRAPSPRRLTGPGIAIPIGHMEGNYFCDAATLAELERAKTASPSAIAPSPGRLPKPPTPMVPLVALRGY